MKIEDLNSQQKILLAQEIWDSVLIDQDEVKLSETQRHELDKRLAQYDIDGEQGTDWNNLKERLLNS